MPSTQVRRRECEGRARGDRGRARTRARRRGDALIPRDKIALVGLRASGKTSVGRALARQLGREFVDLDDEIVRAANDAQLATVGAVLVARGEPAFRELEARALERILASPRRLVLATGGGVVERAENRALLARSATVVWLQVEVAELQRRLRADPDPRPPLLGRDAVDEVPQIAARRDPLYAEVAHGALNAGQGYPETLARELATRLAPEISS